MAIMMVGLTLGMLLIVCIQQQTIWLPMGELLEIIKKLSLLITTPVGTYHELWDL
ncbi:hypothetical protein BMEGG_06349 [Priestia megaterium]